MSADKIRQAWRSRNLREKMLIATLAAVLLLAGGKSLVVDNFYTWRLASQQKLAVAQRHYLWLQQQTSLMAALNQAEERQLPLSLAERVKRSVPEQIAIQEWQQSGDGQLILLIRKTELYPLIKWLVELETRRGVLIKQFLFTQQEGAQVILQEDNDD